jgi:hypothetical protein
LIPCKISVAVEKSIDRFFLFAKIAPILTG